MPTPAAYRAKIGVITPSTCTSVEYDLNQLPVPGVSWHVGRIYLAQSQIGSDEAFVELLGPLVDAMGVAVRDVTTMKPDYLVAAISAPAFWGGLEGARSMERRLRDLAPGVEVTIPPFACVEALRAIGARRISVLTPYQPIADDSVRQFFSESGIEVAHVRGLKVSVATEIAKTPVPILIEALRDLAADDVDAIVQAGADLSLLRLADEAWRWTGKPVLAINVTTAWHALRALGIGDQFPGFGPLFAEH